MKNNESSGIAASLSVGKYTVRLSENNDKPHGTGF